MAKTRLTRGSLASKISGPNRDPLALAAVRRIWNAAGKNAQAESSALKAEAPAPAPQIKEPNI